MLNQVFDPDNRLFLPARQGEANIPKFSSPKLQSLWEFLYPLFAFFFAGATPLLAGFCAAPIILFNIARNGLSAEAITNAIYSESAIITSLFLISSFLPIFFFVWGWLFIFERRKSWNIVLARGDFLRKYFRGALIGFLLMALPVGLLSLSGWFTTEPSPPDRVGWLALPGVIILLAGWIVQGAAEETLTRGFLLPIFGIRLSPFWGVMISSVFFAGLHLLNANLNLIAMINLILFGIFASIYAMWEGSLWGVFAIHSVWNWAQGNLFGLEVSGSNISQTTFLNLTETGPDLITGGAFGPEGGIAITIMLCMSCAGVFLATQKKGNLTPNRT